MTNLSKVFEEQEKQQLDESIVSAIRALPIGIKVEASLIAIALFRQFVKYAIKRYKSSKGSEYKVYSFDFGVLDEDQRSQLTKMLMELTKTFKKNSEIIDSQFKILKKGGRIFVAIINILVLHYRKDKYESVINNPALRRVFDFKRAEVESGRVYDADSDEIEDTSNRLRENEENKEIEQVDEGLVQWLWPLLKAAIVIYAGKVIISELLDLKKESPDEGKFVSYGWEFDDSATIRSVEKVMDSLEEEIYRQDRSKVVKFISYNVFKKRGKVNAYLMITIDDFSDIKKLERIFEKLSRRYDLDFEEMKRGSL